MSLTADMDDKDKAKAFAALSEAPGWKLFQEYLEALCEAARLKTFAAKDAHEMAKYAGAYNAITPLKSWAINNAMQYSRALRKDNLQSQTDSE